MTPARKNAVAWLLAVTALAVLALTAVHIHLGNQFPVDPALVETQFESVAGKQLRLEDARRAGYSDQEMASFLVRRNRAEFDRQWNLALLLVSAVYVVLVLGIGASILLREAKNS